MTDELMKALKQQLPDGTRLDLIVLTPAMSAAQKQFRYIRAFEEARMMLVAERKPVLAVLARVALELGDAKPPSVRTLRRWLQRAKRMTISAEFLASLPQPLPGSTFIRKKDFRRG